MGTTSELAQFNEFFMKYQSRFIRFAYMYIRDEKATEDIVMEAMMSYWENRRRVGDISNVPSYVLMIVRNRCLNYLRREQVRMKMNDEMQRHFDWELNLRISSLESFDPSEVFSKEVQELVDRALSELGGRTRKIFVMSRYENKSNREIAEELGVSVKAIEYHITRALKRLRVDLKDYLGMLLFLGI